MRAGPVCAAGTTAGTIITNQASVSFEIDSIHDTRSSNIDTLKIDELLNLIVTWQDAADVSVNSGITESVLTFLVTNTGNGTDDYTLSAESIIPDDDFDPTLLNLYLDTDGNGLYGSGTDELYIPGTNDPELLPDASVTVFLLNGIPVGLENGESGESRLTATSNTGTGTPGTVIPEAGDDGTNVIIGSSEGNSDATGAYVVSNLEVSLLKSAEILDPTGGTEPIPGAVITYSITITVTGTGTAENVVITDPIPNDTTYRADSLTLNAGSLTDGADADAGDVNVTSTGTMTVNLGDLTSVSPVQTITFGVTIN